MEGFHLIISRFGFAFVFVLAGFHSHVIAQPTAITPQDVARIHQLTTVSDNFAGSPQYDLETPVELAIKIHHLHMPEGRYAQIVFTIDELGEGAEHLPVSGKEQHIATLHLSKAVRKKSLKPGQFKGGVPAVILAWPATEWNYTPSDFLIDELVLLKTGHRWVFQNPDPRMRKHRKSTGIETATAESG